MATYNAVYRVWNETTSTYDTINFATLAQLVTLADSRSVQVAIDSLETAVAGAIDMRIVPDIAARDGLTGLAAGNTVLVIDASGDPTVTAGWALYVWDGSAFLKLSEGESLDVTLEWSAIQNGPASTPTAIDGAVANAHTHANKATIDKFAEPSGVLNFDSKKVFLGNVFTVAGSEPSVKTPLWFQVI